MLNTTTEIYNTVSEWANGGMDGWAATVERVSEMGVCPGLFPRTGRLYRGNDVG